MQKKLLFFINGIETGKKLAEKQVNDCSGAVSTDGRGNTKIKNVDDIEIKGESFSTMSK